MQADGRNYNFGMAEATNLVLDQAAFLLHTTPDVHLAYNLCPTGAEQQTT